MKKYLLIAVCFALSLSVMGCNHTTGTGVQNSMDNTTFWRSGRSHTNSDLARQTYYAVDRVIWQSGGRTGMPVIVGTVANVDTLETSDTFGRVVTEQVASRLTQTGHVVSEVKLRNSVNIKQDMNSRRESGEYVLTRDVDTVRKEYKVGRVITGTYGVAGDEILVNLKMIDVATGRILGAVDYSVDVDANTMKLIQNEGSSFYGSSIAY